MTYTAPIRDIVHTLDAVAGFGTLAEQGLLGELDADVARSILEEAGKFAQDRIVPLNRQGDLEGAKLANGAVKMPKGWRDVYEQWVEAGWGSLPGPEEFGGQGLPIMLSMAVGEIWQSACMAFSLNPMLTQGAAEALALYGTDALKEQYLRKLVSGEWSGTMQLTEPQAGSDLRFIKTKAVPQNDGSYKLSGTKIFITYGDHDLADNIVHMVLARTPHAPEGTKGISLFLVPKFLPGQKRNDIRAASIEHKLGIHASPTCVMQMGDDGGATGWLVGKENEGLNHMFLMMNRARLGIGIQGVAIAERAYQQALAFAKERKQGAAPTPPSPASGGGHREGVEMTAIIDHPDVRRMLLTMKACTAAARAICYLTARALDVSERSKDQKERASALAMASLLTPVAKAFATDLGVETTSLGIQVHGGMGFIEETGAAQHYRDSRIAPIYEGTNGIQAVDLVARKLPLEGGDTIRRHIAGLRDILTDVKGANDPHFGNMGARLTEAVDAFEEASKWLLKTLQSDRSAALAGATPYLRLFGLASGGVWLAKGALAASRGNGEAANAQVALARFFAEQHVVEAPALARSVMDGADAILSAEALN